MKCIYDKTEYRAGNDLPVVIILTHSLRTEQRDVHILSSLKSAILMVWTSYHTNITSMPSEDLKNKQILNANYGSIFLNFKVNV